MSKYIGIWILVWCCMNFIFHAIDYKKAPNAALVYYITQGILEIGIFLFIYSVINKGLIRLYPIPKYKAKRLLKVVLIYSTWCMLVDVLIFMEIGAQDTAFYEMMDMGILGLGGLWARLIAQTVSGIGWVIGFVVSIISKVSPIIDDSIGIIAGLIGIIAGIIWVSILITKRVEGKVNLDNAKLDNKIKNQQLKKLYDDTKK